MAKRRCRKATTELRDESLFEVVNINDFQNTQQTVNVSESGNSNSSNPHKPKAIGIGLKRTRATQVYSEDIDQLIINTTIPSVLGVNAAIECIGTETNVPQCRFCLRRVSQTNLKVILSKHKPKALAAFKIKIYPNDAYPLACCNCLNLLDMFLDFKNTALKARNLLLSKRMHLESDGWDDPSTVEAIAKSKAAVEQHKRQVDRIFDEHTSTTNEPIENSELCEESETVDDLTNSYASDGNVGEQLSNVEVIMNPSPGNSPIRHSPVMLKQSPTNSSDEGEDNDDNEADEDFVPSSSEDKEFQKVSMKRKRGRPRKYEPNVPTIANHPQLCDLCGERVSAQRAEGHKNRHLGIKPYKCPVIDCGLTLYSRASLGRHVKRVHENGVPVHECDICGKHIRGPLWQLKYHQRSHGTEERNCICPICGKGFTRPRYLRQHAIVHSGEFPHKCSYCGKKFNNKWSMKTHEKNMHEKKNHIPLAEPVAGDQTAGASNYENNYCFE